MKDNAVFKNAWLPWLFLLPSFIILLIFIYYPAVQAWVLSLHRANIFLGTMKFIGFENFQTLFTGVLSKRYIQVVFQ